MPLIPTQLTITPPSDTSKLLAVVGSVAVNERVAVTVIGVAVDAAVPAGLVLRLVSQCGAVEYARFPSATGDAWGISGANATCTLLLNTKNLRDYFTAMCANARCEAEISLESGTADNLYGTARIVIRNWVQSPLDPVAGSSTMQAQLTVLTGRIETHQHDDEEGSASFPHNNLTGRDASGAHPAIESALGDVALTAASALSAANVASDNAITALELAQQAVALKGIIQDNVELAQLGPDDTMGMIKTRVNSIVTALNTWRGQA